MASLLDSVANQLHKDLRAEGSTEPGSGPERRARRRQDPAALRVEIISALWLRSFTLDKVAGADPAELQIDITRDRAIDDNQFEAELATIEGESVSTSTASAIGSSSSTTRTCGRSCSPIAKNDKLFPNGEDIDHLAKEIRSVISGPEHVSQAYRVVVLKQKWDSDPWSEFEEKDQPKNWDGRLADGCDSRVSREARRRPRRTGSKRHLQEGRNTIRFLLPQKGNRHILLRPGTPRPGQGGLPRHAVEERTTSAYADLQAQVPERTRRQAQGPFRPLRHSRCLEFCRSSQVRLRGTELMASQGDKIPEAVDKIIKQDVFIPEEFEEYVADPGRECENRSASCSKTCESHVPVANRASPGSARLRSKSVSSRCVRRARSPSICVGWTCSRPRPAETYDDAWNRMKGQMAPAAANISMKPRSTSRVPSSVSGGTKIRRHHNGVWLGGRRHPR